MAFETNEEIAAKTEELRQRVAASRIAKGQPPEPPEKFVPIPLGVILAEQLAPFYKIAVQYAAVIASGSLVHVDTSKLEKYRETAKLARMCIGRHSGLIASSVEWCLREMDEINAAINEGKESEIDKTSKMRRFSFFLEYLNESPWADTYDYKSTEPHHIREAKIKAEVERLKNDPDAYQAEQDAAWRHYSEIEHLI
ncbi:hypothetical protein ABER61_02915 [Brevibacillus formosus]|uniref:Uncharacterized protein n=1 Tax=Brevibacillus formosus TaxID=54913 RepID=A0A837KHB0_9BACL|nr:hypothetical protein [Brevibacillus formosus]KLH96758.1 hypothetical protein AA984_22375 [Brevibacillus formosus]MED1955183.1 hypothetical protein [Brevibacillus formosus]PSJ94940.1 hypothetical protein C7R91_16785 [Brevibacillus formosus]GED58429.1 hypothetical protein BFO01nite_25610 [Brevibacillus formosus]